SSRRTVPREVHVRANRLLNPLHDGIKVRIRRTIALARPPRALKLANHIPPEPQALLQLRQRAYPDDAHAHPCPTVLLLPEPVRRPRLDADLGPLAQPGPHRVPHRHLLDPPPRHALAPL